MLTFLFIALFLGVLFFGTHSLYLVVYAGTHPLHIAVQILAIVVLVTLLRLLKKKLSTPTAK